jgi:hypothetical protein
MRSAVLVAIACSLVSGLTAGADGTRTQPSLDRIVGPDFFGRRLVIKKLTAVDVGALAAAGRTPIGFEAALDGTPATLAVDASGKTLRAVLDEIITADTRYEWRDEDGVIVLRPRASWTDREDPLHRSVGPIRFDDVGVAEALRIAGALFGEELSRSQSDDLGDHQRFTLDIPPGTLLDALNGIVRAHGALAWGVEPFPPGPRAPGTVVSPFMVSLVRGGTGRAHGLGVHLDRAPQIPEQLDKWPAPRPPATGALLDRVVGPKPNGNPIIFHSVTDIADLAQAARLPLGLELAPQEEARAAIKAVTLTGLTVRDALNEMIARDARYEWREVDGVIVIRPLAAWTQPDHPLSRETGPVHLDKARLIDAITYQQSLIEPGLRSGREPDHDGDERRISVDLPNATHLALANAIAKSHGEVCWIYEELDGHQTEFFGGRRHQLSFRGPDGSGRGFAFR